MATNDYKATSQDYMTPPEIYQPILEFMGKEKFCADVCCSRRTIPASFYFTKKGMFLGNSMFPLFEECGLSMCWTNFKKEVEICWMNPPFNKTKIWLEKAFNEVKTHDVEVWCCVAGDRLNTKYFQKLLNENNNWFIASLEGKTNFYNSLISIEENEKNAKNGGLNTPIFIIYIGKNSKEYAKRWKEEKPIKSIVLQ